MNKKEKYSIVLNWFNEKMPVAETELMYSNPYELLVAVILSAQCTDKRVNMVTPKLFESFPIPEILANATFEEVFSIIRSISYPNNKAKHLIGMAKMLMNDFNGEIPNNIIDLQKLPGVGRKTANVVVSVIFQQPAMAVDTHVFRVSKRLGLINKNTKTPLDAENQLVKHIPKSQIHIAHHWLILHGRYTCMARNPNCEVCELKLYCNFYKDKTKKAES